MLESAAIRLHSHPRVGGDSLVIKVFKLLKSKWIPAYAGMTEKRVGMTEKRVGMTRKRVGMTGQGVFNE